MLKMPERLNWKQENILLNYANKEYFGVGIKNNILEILSSNSIFAPWGKLFKKSIIQNIQINAYVFRLIMTSTLKHL